MTEHDMTERELQRAWAPRPDALAALRALKDEDTHLAEIMATGAVWMALMDGFAKNPDHYEVEVVTVDGTATNQLEVRLPFLKSAYHITVTQVPDTVREDEKGRKHG